MSAARAYYFIRANGGSVHVDPSVPNAHVEGQPALPASGQYNHIEYCLRHGIARIGWPDTGDLRIASKSDALANAYELATLPPHVQAYLRDFREIEVGSVVLVPDKSVTGSLIIGVVTKEYSYFHNAPDHPYENAHRVGVRWDQAGSGFARYTADELGLSTKGGFWLRAFHRIDNDRNAGLIERIDAARKSKLSGVTHERA